MNQKIHLTITGCQSDETSESSVTTHSARGEYFEKNGCCYFFYEEAPSDGNSVIKNRIKLKDTVLELTKRGGVNTRMVFESGKEYLTDYATPYGILKMGISTRPLEVFRAESQLKIRIDYSLTSESIPLSECTLTILAVSAS